MKTLFILFAMAFTFAGFGTVSAADFQEAGEVQQQDLPYER
ncbi:hypothetical protein [Alkalicoccus halolimnae]|jgi:hypothetical protein|uniref:Uncharacterized protein n=1 Tax=Alkalicoccus halolimnae TaxID=1667239 RepID=A0AAJ8N2Q7_9BACI|nr:hypothetical protein [Alkalicoccus halolimnae]